MNKFQMVEANSFISLEADYSENTSEKLSFLSTKSMLYEAFLLDEAPSEENPVSYSLFNRQPIMSCYQLYYTIFEL